MKIKYTCAVLMVGFVIVLLSHNTLADEKPQMQQKSSTNKNNLQVQRKMTHQSNTKARKIGPSCQKRFDQNREKRHRLREQDPVHRLFDLRLIGLTG